MNASTPQTVRVVDSRTGCPTIPLVIGKGSAKAVMWPGNGALYRTFQIIELAPGDRTIDLSHPSDSVYYVVAGEGAIVDLASSERSPLVEGAMVHIDRGDAYRFDAAEGTAMTLLGGPCPADPSFYAGLSADKD
jgi:quercetin dioxygenase-like cupin family protein